MNKTVLVMGMIFLMAVALGGTFLAMSTVTASSDAPSSYGYMTSGSEAHLCDPIHDPNCEPPGP